MIHRRYPVLAWPEGSGKNVLISRTLDFKRPIVQKVTNLFPFSQQCAKPLDEGVWFWKVALKNGGETRVRKFKIEKRGYFFRAFDFGGEKTMTAPEYIKTTPATLYSKSAGYGWKRLENPQIVNQPDSKYHIPSDVYMSGHSGNRKQTLFSEVLRDAIQSDIPAEFAVDLPSGEYEVIVVSGNPNTEEKHNFYEFDIMGEGEKKCDISILYKNYIFEYRKFRVKVLDGQLNLEFNSKTIDRFWRVNAVMIYPYAKRREAVGDRNRLIQRMTAAPEPITKSFNISLPKTSYPQKPILKFNEKEKKRGFVVFRPASNEKIFWNRRPLENERIEEFKVGGTPGEFVNLPISVFPIKDVDEFSLTLPKTLSSEKGIELNLEKVELQKIIYDVHRVTRMSNLINTRFLTWTPRRLSKSEPVFDLWANRSRNMRIALKIPQSAQPGIYRARCKLSAGEKELGGFDLNVEVYPFKLVPHNLYIFNYYDERIADIPSGSSKKVRQISSKRRQEFLRHYIECCQDVPVLFLDLKPHLDAKGNVIINSPAVKMRTFLRKTGSRISYVYVNWQYVLRSLPKLLNEKDAHLVHQNYLDAVPVFSDRFWKTFARLYSETEKNIKRVAPKAFVINQIWDEVNSNANRYMLKAGRTILKENPNAHIFVNTLKGMYYGSGDKNMAMNQIADVWWSYSKLNEQDIARAIKDGTFLIGSGSRSGTLAPRSSTGFALWRQGLRGFQFWAWCYWYMSMSTDMDGPAFNNGCVVYPYAKLQNTMPLEALRQGLYDYRYVKTLKALIANSMKSKETTVVSEAEKANAYLRSLWNSLDPFKASDILIDKGFDPYDKTRAEIAGWIKRLIDANKKKIVKWKILDIDGFCASPLPANNTGASPKQIFSEDFESGKPRGWNGWNNWILTTKSGQAPNPKLTDSLAGVKSRWGAFMPTKDYHVNSGMMRHSLPEAGGYVKASFDVYVQSFAYDFAITLNNPDKYHRPVGLHISDNKVYATWYDDESHGRRKLICKCGYGTDYPIKVPSRAVIEVNTSYRKHAGLLPGHGRVSWGKDLKHLSIEFKLHKFFTRAGWIQFEKPKYTNSVMAVDNIEVVAAE